MWLMAGALLGHGCVVSPAAPSGASVDVLEFLIGDPALWPRMGDQHQHQLVEPGQVCWTKYTLGWSFECWRWDDTWIYHEVDHAIDGNRRWEHYTFSDGRWLPRRLTLGTVWELDVPDNRIRWVDAACQPEPERAFPYRMRAWVEPGFDAGGDLGLRDVVVLEYQVDPARAAPGSAERFYLARGAGWFLWTRADGVRVAFNRLGGVARPRTPWCVRDFEAVPAPLTHLN